jgi:cytochrome c553
MTSLRIAAVATLALSFLQAQPVRAQSDRVFELIQNALTLDFDAKRGAPIYRDHCSSCHGQQAAGNADSFIPALAGQRQAYLIKQFADFSQRERDSISMHRVLSRAHLSEPQTWVNVAAYLNGLPPREDIETGDGSKVNLGEAIFREQCSSCHEEDARGDDDGFIPSIRNQHYSYLLRQMHALRNGHRRNIDRDLDGFIGSLPEDELRATADYLSRLRGPTRDRSKMRDNGAVGD